VRRGTSTAFRARPLVLSVSFLLSRSAVPRPFDFAFSPFCSLTLCHHAAAYYRVAFRDGRNDRIPLVCIVPVRAKLRPPKLVLVINVQIWKAADNAAPAIGLISRGAGDIIAA